MADTSDLMTVAEVAKFLRVAERTVYSWAQQGKLPGGKLGTAWRFKRSEIERWINKNLTGRSPEALSLQIAEVLTPERIMLLDCSTKREVLEKLVECLGRAAEVRDAKELSEAIWRRESLMSTGIGLGIAVPHVRLASVLEPVMAVAVTKEAMADYESLDGRPIRIVFMIAAGQDQHTHHIQLLAAIAQLAKDEKLKVALLAAESPRTIFDILVGVSPEAKEGDSHD